MVAPASPRLRAANPVPPRLDPASPQPDLAPLGIQRVHGRERQEAAESSASRRAGSGCASFSGEEFGVPRPKGLRGGAAAAGGGVHGLHRGGGRRRHVGGGGGGWRPRPWTVGADNHGRRMRAAVAARAVLWC